MLQNQNSGAIKDITTGVVIGVLCATIRNDTKELTDKHYDKENRIKIWFI